MGFNTDDLNGFDKQYRQSFEIRWDGMPGTTIDDYMEYFKVFLSAYGFTQETIEDYFKGESDGLQKSSVVS